MPAVRGSHQRAGHQSDVGSEITDLEFLVDALETINGGVESSDLTTLDFQLLLELLDFTRVGIPSRNILRLELVLN